MRFVSTAGIKTLLVLGPMALALSSLASNSSYAYNYVDNACPPNHYDDFNCPYEYPYGFYDDVGVWWPDNHWRRGVYHGYGHGVDRGLDHGDFGHGSFGHGGSDLGGGERGGGGHDR